MGYLTDHFQTISLFLGAAVDKKTAANKPKKVEISATPCSFFYISQTTTAKRLRFSPIE
jgi:hypothetical protein